MSHKRVLRQSYTDAYEPMGAFSARRGAAGIAAPSVKAAQRRGGRAHWLPQGGPVCTRAGADHTCCSVSYSGVRVPCREHRPAPHIHQYKIVGALVHKTRSIRFVTLLACSLPFILPARAWPAAQNGASDASRPATSNKTFRDPLGQGQDPSIEVIDGYYNLVQSSPDAHTITVRRSRSLKTLFDAKQSTVWRGGKKGTPCCDLWAPDIHNFNGKWYIYFAADGGQNINHRLYVIESDHARGPYHFKARLKTPGNKWAIDATAFKNSDGKLYLLWSGWPGDANRQQNIYLARLSNPWTVALNSPRTPLSAPTYDWETKGTLMGKTSDVRPNVNEGPAVLKHEKKIFVTFSASGCWTPNYKLGMLMANDDANLMDSRSWKKLPRPVFSSNSAAGVYGPGHNGFFKSPDGTEDWFVYHAVTDPHGNCGNERKVWAQKVRWRKGHTLPSFGKPIAPGTELKLPSGDEGLGNH